MSTTNSTVFNSSETNPMAIAARKAKKLADEPFTIIGRVQDLTAFPLNYRRNNHHLDALVKNHRSEFIERYQARQVEGSDKISAQDLFSFLQECFYSDEILLMEKASEDRDFFQSINSYKKLLKIAENYFVKAKGTNPKKLNVKEAELTFDECFEILDFWFQTDEDVLVISENEFETKKAKKQDVRSTLEDTIAKYQKLVHDSKSGVEKQVLQTTIDTLQKKLEELEEMENYSPEREARKEKLLRDLKKKEEKRIKALREIFDFYSKHQLHGVKAPTFEKLDRQTKSVNMGKFSVILSNYLIKVDTLKLKEAFSKVAQNSEELTFEQFYLLLQKIAKDAELISERKIVKPNPEIRKEYKPDSYKQTPVPHKPVVKNEVRKMEQHIRQIKNEHFKVEDMWEHMGLYDGSYKNNFQGLYLAFHLKEKETHRVPATDRNQYKSPEQKAIDDLKEEIIKRNELRREAREGRLIEKSVLQNFKESPQKTTKAERSSYKKEDSYAAIQANKIKTNLFDKKLTLKEIERSEYNDIKKMGIEGKFSPNDLIEENDEEDNFYLAEYNIEEEKLKVQEKQNKSVKKIRIPSEDAQSYTRGYNSKSNRSAGNASGYSNLLLKSSTVDEMEYGRKYQTPREMGYANEQVKTDVYNSVKQQKNPLNLKNSQTMSPYDGHPPSQKYDRDSYQKRMGEYILERANQVQKEAQRKEHKVATSLINIHNSKIEQGMRVARR